MEALDRRLVNAIEFYDEARRTVIDAKNKIVADTDAAQQEIDRLEESMDSGTPSTQEMEIEKLVSTTLLEQFEYRDHSGQQRWNRSSPRPTTGPARTPQAGAADA